MTRKEIRNLDQTIYKILLVKHENARKQSEQFNKETKNESEMKLKKIEVCFDSHKWYKQYSREMILKI